MRADLAAFPAISLKKILSDFRRLFQIFQTCRWSKSRNILRVLHYFNMVRSLVSIPYPIGYLISFETLQGIQRHPNPNSLTNANIMETVRESTIFFIQNVNRNLYSFYLTTVVSFTNSSSDLQGGSKLLPRKFFLIRRLAKVAVASSCLNDCNCLTLNLTAAADAIRLFVFTAVAHRHRLMRVCCLLSGVFLYSHWCVLNWNCDTQSGRYQHSTCSSLHDLAAYWQSNNMLCFFVVYVQQNYLLTAQSTSENTSVIAHITPPIWLGISVFECMC